MGNDLQCANGWRNHITSEAYLADARELHEMARNYLEALNRHHPDHSEVLYLVYEYGAQLGRMVSLVSYAKRMGIGECKELHAASEVVAQRLVELLQEVAR